MDVLSYYRWRPEERIKTDIYKVLAIFSGRKQQVSKNSNTAYKQSKKQCVRNKIRNSGNELKRSGTVLVVLARRKRMRVHNNHIINDVGVSKKINARIVCYKNEQWYKPYYML